MRLRVFVMWFLVNVIPVNFLVKVMGICEGYVEHSWLIWSVILVLSVNINLTSMYLKNK